MSGTHPQTGFIYSAHDATVDAKLPWAGVRLACAADAVRLTLCGEANVLESSSSAARITRCRRIASFACLGHQSASKKKESAEQRIPSHTWPPMARPRMFRPHPRWCSRDGTLQLASGT